jgi:hypothetical protein
MSARSWNLKHKLPIALPDLFNMRHICAGSGKKWTKRPTKRTRSKLTPRTEVPVNSSADGTKGTSEFPMHKSQGRHEKCPTERPNLTVAQLVDGATVVQVPFPATPNKSDSRPKKRLSLGEPRRPTNQTALGRSCTKVAFSTCHEVIQVDKSPN